MAKREAYHKFLENQYKAELKERKIFDCMIFCLGISVGIAIALTLMLLGVLT